MVLMATARRRRSAETLRLLTKWDRHMPSWILKFCAAIAASTALCANAALVKTDDVILDTTTGLEWLNVRLPNGLSYQQVQSGIGGWTLNGWRLASFAEVGGLATRYIGAANGGYSSAELSGLSIEYAESADLFVQTMGMNVAFNDPRAVYTVHDYPGLRQITTQGYFLDTNTSDPRLGLFEATAVLEDGYGIYGPPAQFVPFGRFGLFEDFLEPTRAGPYLSTLLVRQGATEVPEPPAILLALSALGLGALLLSRRRA